MGMNLAKQPLIASTVATPFPAEPVNVPIPQARPNVSPLTKREARALTCPLWVSPSLDSYEADEESRTVYADDMERIDPDGQERAYRRLTPAYYVWLFEMMKRAKVKLAGQVDLWNSLTQKFATVHAYAGRYFDHKTLADLLALGTRAGYNPPRIRAWLMIPIPFKPIEPASPAFQEFMAKQKTKVKRSGMRSRKQSTPHH